MPGWELLDGETPIDPSCLKDRSIKNRAQLNLAEAENILEPIRKYLAAKPTARSAPFTLTWAKKLHREMFNRVWMWAGQFRQEELNIGVPWHQVEVCSQAMLDDLQCWKESGMDLLEQSVMIHQRAAWIHPFPNGNGRWARMLANIWLKRHEHPPTDWPATINGTKSPVRDEYLQAIKAADDGDLGLLFALSRRFTPVS
jgi:Fic-DOC domain mobile mystery protein B